MNGFYKKSIRPSSRTVKKWEKKASRWVKGHVILTIIIVILGGFTLKGVMGAIRMGEPFSVKQIIISAVTNGIETDAYGHTNILILGVGGEGHDGANLTDTMIVASIDHKNNLVPMLSIPRDMFVENETVGWGSRLNGVYQFVLESSGSHEIAMGELQGEIEEILGIDIQYYAMVDFQGFEDIVDAVGGIDIDLETALDDPFYPAPDGSGIDFEPLYIPAGPQELDGKTALKYVRSRKTTSDFDRALRQQEVITAIKDKALSLGFLLNPAKISNTFTAISENFTTNLTVNEILNLASLAGDITSDSLVSEVVNDLAYETAGFLYTPPREEYNGAFVLIPYAKTYEELHLFAQLFFYHPDIYQNQTKIEVLNGTSTASLAGLSKMYLHRYGFNVTAYGNAYEKDKTDTMIYVLNEEALEDDETLNLLPSLTFGEISYDVPTEYLPENWDSDADIIIELGEDFADYYDEHEELFYIGFY
ncbi:MAG: LCP family protein required for cell wall assembly [Oceanicoccus sp.]|jgi:LCP family protein required for cell wall assembly